ncbi:chaperonin [Mycolicibacterium phlei DSM 43239 = CCUG 21000]|uniref:Co-chaperonin GroES n=1 Tax=Mycolicibacterium phlei DSM 43239 = CCUG 21000 TaxID=1226750 RepID=A0A5N5V7U4_MYCPH|nr:chaperonin [Mycolicibacterium phlei DSM 43239 = CCUG 21000]KXW63578.1 chaperonin [Mycolicibacterium phlei DSM 43239 = CCUG 21000]
MANPRAGTRDDGAWARTPAVHLVTQRSGNPGRTPELVEGSIVASVNIKPLEDKILVQANEAETTTASGLVIPDTAKEKPQEGTVVAVGPGRWDEDGEKRIPLDVAEGDTVIYSKYGGTEIKYNGEEYLILSARDVLAVVNK